MKRLLLALCVVLVLGGNGWAESLDYEGTTYDSWTIDKDYTTGDVSLNFGDTANSLRWDDDLDSFMFSNWVNSNTIMGEEAGISLTNGAGNTFLGYRAGEYTTGGPGPWGGTNTFIGVTAGRKNTTGYSNTYVGAAAGKFGVAAHYNTAIGWNALLYNETGIRNTVIGKAAGFAGTDSSYNVFVGNDAGIRTTSSSNTFLGTNTGWCNISGEKNIYIGNEAGYNYDNIVYRTPPFPLVGCGNGGVGSNNVAIGYKSLWTGGAGNNVAIGTESGQFNEGDYNVFIGYRTGQSITNGTGNVFIGSSVASLSYEDDEYVGYQEISNTLMIDNELTDIPLIYGEFDNDLVKVNGELDVSTTTGALIVPRLTTTERNLLAAVNGMIIYNTIDNAFNFYENGAWVTKVNE